MTVKLILLPAAIALRKLQFSKAQKYVDSECIKRMTPFVPVANPRWHHAGRLRDSVGNPAPGVIVYTAPFARHDYYANVRHDHPKSGNPNGQRMWFEYMKMKEKQAILRGTAAILGARSS